MKNDITISVQKSLFGFLVLSTIYNNQYIKKQYEGYSIADAKKDFLNSIN